MKTYYFIGRPQPGKRAQFFEKLTEIGGTPPGWKIYPHVSGDGLALHLIEAESPEEIHAHLDHFAGMYTHAEFIEIDSPRSPSSYRSDHWRRNHVPGSPGAKW